MLIANDVVPIELVVWMPALCKSMDVPYMIIKSKSRLGALVHQKNASCVAITEVAGGDSAALAKIVEAARALYNDNANAGVEWGTNTMGLKTQYKVNKHDARIKEELARKKALMSEN